MFGIGFPELILILALALIVVGPDKLPDLARSVAKTLMDLKKTAEGLKNSLEAEDNPLSEIKPELEEAAKKFKETILDAETHTLKDPTGIPGQTSFHDETTGETRQPDHAENSSAIESIEAAYDKEKGEDNISESSGDINTASDSEKKS